MVKVFSTLVITIFSIVVAKKAKKISPPTYHTIITEDFKYDVARPTILPGFKLPPEPEFNITTMRYLVDARTDLNGFRQRLFMMDLELERRFSELERQIIESQAKAKRLEDTNAKDKETKKLLHSHRKQVHKAKQRVVDVRNGLGDLQTGLALHDTQFVEELSWNQNWTMIQRDKETELNWLHDRLDIVIEDLTRPPPVLDPTPKKQNLPTEFVIGTSTESNGQPSVIERQITTVTTNEKNEIIHNVHIDPCADNLKDLIKQSVLDIVDGTKQEDNVLIPSCGCSNSGILGASVVKGNSVLLERCENSQHAVEQQSNGACETFFVDNAQVVKPMHKILFKIDGRTIDPETFDENDICNKISEYQGLV